MASPLTIDITSSNKKSEEKKDNRTHFFNEDAGASDYLKLAKGDVSGIIKYQAASQLINLGVNAAKSFISFKISHIGDTTGDYLRQEQIENSIKIATTCFNISSSFVMGLAVGGPAGGAVALGTTLGSLAISSATSAANYNMGIRRANAQSAFNSSNLGVILTGGSR